MSELFQDVRFAFRALLRHRSFAAVAILTLALGIGANTAIFSVIDHVLLRPTPFSDLHRLVMVWETDRNTRTMREPGSVPDYVDYRTRSRTLQSLATFIASDVSLSPATGDPLRLAALTVSPDFLPMLGVAVVAGRTFTTDDLQSRAAIISDSLWARAFNRGPVIGAQIRLNDESWAVVGVAAEGADFGALQILSASAYSRGFAQHGSRSSVDVWLSLTAPNADLPRSTHPNLMVGRLAATSSVAAAQQELAAIATDLEAAYPENAARGVFVEPLAEVIFGASRRPLFVLFGAVALVLLVASVNVANLLLTRSVARQREVALRAALGAGPARLARQFLVEGLVLTLIAAAGGVVVAFIVLRVLLAVAPSDIPRLADAGIDFRVLAVTLITSVAVGVVFGLVPVAQARRVDVQRTLKAGPQSTAATGLSRLRAAFVVAELSLAIVLMVGAGLVMRSFWHLTQVDPGFQTDGVVKAEYQLPHSRYPADFARFPDFKEMHAFSRSLLDRARQLPGVEAAAIAGNHPLDAGFTNSFRVVGREAEGRAWPEISVRRVTEGYFPALSLGAIRGRLLSEGDGTAAPAVCVINQAAADRFWPQGEPIGHQIRMYGVARTIVGVVGNEKFQGLDQPTPIAVYLPLWQAPSGDGAGVLIIKTSGDPAAAATATRSLIRETDPELAVFGVETLDDTRSRALSQPRFAMLLLAVFAAVALALAAIGIHGVVAHGVAQRTREIGIRMALGARRSTVFRLIAGELLVLIAIALAVGLTGAFALSRVLDSLLFGVDPGDPMTFLAVALFLALVAMGSGYWPTRRAVTIDPAAALRIE